MADDLYNEFLNLALARTLSPNNTTAGVIEKHSKQLHFAHQVRIEYERQMKEVHAGRNKEVARDEDFAAILKAMEETDCFRKVEGRTGYKGFEEIPENIYAHKNAKDQSKWANEHIKRFARHGFLHTDNAVETSQESLDIELTLDEDDAFVVNLRSRQILRADAE